MNVEKWIEHLHHPLVLAGFSLFIVATIVSWLKPEKLSGAAIERLFGRGMSYVFILSLLAIITGIYIGLPATSDPAQAPNSSVIQNTSGDESPAVNTNRDVNISYGISPKENEKQPAAKSQAESSPVAVPKVVEQTTKGDKSPVINSQGDVNINYGE